MEAKSTDKKTFHLTNEGQLLGEIFYKNSLSIEADINVPNLGQYKVNPVGFFGTKLSVTKDDKEIANLVMNWLGQIVIELPDAKTYALKLETWFSGKYIVENSAHEKIIRLEPHFNWNKFEYKYQITSLLTPGLTEYSDLLLILSVYATNFYIDSLSGTHAGMMS